MYCFKEDIKPVKMIHKIKSNKIKIKIWMIEKKKE